MVSYCFSGWVPESNEASDGMVWFDRKITPLVVRWLQYIVFFRICQLIHGGLLDYNCLFFYDFFDIYNKNQGEYKRNCREKLLTVDRQTKELIAVCLNDRKDFACEDGRAESK